MTLMGSLYSFNAFTVSIIENQTNHDLLYTSVGDTGDVVAQLSVDSPLPTFVGSEAVNPSTFFRLTAASSVL